MSSASRVSPSTRYPFGVFSLVFVILSLLLLTFFKHPDNSPSLIVLADFLWTLGIVSLIIIAFVYIYSAPDKTGITGRRYNPLGMWVAFLVGLGALAILKTASPYMSIFDPFSNMDLDLSSLPIDINLFMFLVATIEELMFRAALAMFIYWAFPHKDEWVKLLASLLLSNGLFAIWHWFAYQADVGMMVIAFFAGGVLTVGYWAGSLIGGGEISFIGIVCGHWLWNISSAGGMESILLVSFVLIIVTGVVLLVNRHAMLLLVRSIKVIAGGR